MRNNQTQSFLVDRKNHLIKKKSVKLSQTLEDSSRWRSLLGFMWVDRKGCCSEDGTARWLKWELCQTDEMLTATVSSIQSDFRCFREML